MSPDGRVDALIVGVGGFLGIGAKDVAVNFNAVKQIKRDNKVYLTVNATKDELKAAPGFKYDRETTVGYRTATLRPDSPARTHYCRRKALPIARAFGL